MKKFSSLEVKGQGHNKAKCTFCRQKEVHRLTSVVHVMETYRSKVWRISVLLFLMYCLQVKFLDLTLPQYWLPRYDWVLSMEVLEHISVQFETVVLDNVDRAAGYGAVLSWASPGQGGFHHVNNRPAEYLNKVMKQRGFQLDLPTSQKLRSVSKLPWLKRNLMVFYRM